jgi:hypothetical protein
MTFQFKLDAAPTFEATVAIPVPGGTTAPVKFVFKHYKKDDLAELFKPDSPLPDVEVVLALVESWELDDKFEQASVEKLLQNYQAAAGAIVRKYMDEIGPARLGN